MGALCISEFRRGQGLQTLDGVCSLICKWNLCIYILMYVFYNSQPAYDFMYSLACVRMIIGFGCRFVYTLRMVCYYGFSLL